MNIEYKQKSNKAAIVWLSAVVLLIAYVIAFPDFGNINEGNNVTLFVLMSVLMISYPYYIWTYIKAKGYPTVVSVIGVILLTVFPILVLFLLFLPDRFPIEY